jgi:hypothetical protein
MMGAGNISEFPVCPDLNHQLCYASYYFLWCYRSVSCVTHLKLPSHYLHPELYCPIKEILVFTIP